MKTLSLILCAMVLTGCMSSKGRIKSPGVTVQSPKDGNGATLAQEQSTGVLPLPAGSTVTVTKFEAVPAMVATEGQSAVAAQPAREVTEVVLSRDTAWRKDETKIAADTGKIDTTVALRKVQASEARVLLYAALGAAIAGGVFFWMHYPSPALICGAASVVFFLAWKVSDLPSWFWVVGAIGLAGAGALWLGHERGEKNATKVTA